MVGAGCVHGREPGTRETEQAACRVEEEEEAGQPADQRAAGGPEPMRSKRRSWARINAFGSTTVSPPGLETRKIMRRGAPHWRLRFAKPRRGAAKRGAAPATTLSRLRPRSAHTPIRFAPGSPAATYARMRRCARRRGGGRKNVESLLLGRSPRRGDLQTDRCPWPCPTCFALPLCQNLGSDSRSSLWRASLPALFRCWV